MTSLSCKLYHGCPTILANVNKLHATDYYIMSIAAYFHHPISKLAYLILAEALCFQNPGHCNTVIVQVRRDDSVVIAADTLTQTWAGPTPKTSYACKIEQLDPYSVFAASGLTSGAGPVGVYEEAKTQFISSNPASANAEAWANSVEAIYYQSPEEWKKVIVAILRSYRERGEAVTYGIFEQSAHFVDSAYVEIKYAETPIGISFMHEPPAQTPRTNIWAMSRVSAFIGDLLREDSDRTRLLRSAMRQKAALIGYQGIDLDAYQIQSSIQAAIDEKIDASIGGDVAVVILEAQKPLRWFHKPEVCN